MILILSNGQTGILALLPIILGTLVICTALAVVGNKATARRFA